MAVTNTRLRTGLYSIVERITSTDPGDGVSRSVRVTVADAPEFMRRFMDVAKSALSLASDNDLANQSLTPNQMFQNNALRNYSTTPVGAPSGIGGIGSATFENATPPTYVDFAITVTAAQDDMIHEIKAGHSIDN